MTGSGKYIEGKIHYFKKSMNYIKRGKYPRPGRTESGIVEYEVINENAIELVEGSRYNFELKDGKALIISKSIFK